MPYTGFQLALKLKSLEKFKKPYQLSQHQSKIATRFRVTQSAKAYFQNAVAGQAFVCNLNLLTGEIFIEPTTGLGKDKYGQPISLSTPYFSKPRLQYKARQNVQVEDADAPGCYKKAWPGFRVAHTMTNIRFFRQSDTPESLGSPARIKAAQHHILGFSLIKGGIEKIEKFTNKSNALHVDSSAFAYDESFREYYQQYQLAHRSQKGKVYELSELAPADISLKVLITLLVELPNGACFKPESVKTLNIQNLQASLDAVVTESLSSSHTPSPSSSSAYVGLA